VVIFIVLAGIVIMWAFNLQQMCKENTVIPLYPASQCCFNYCSCLTLHCSMQ